MLVGLQLIDCLLIQIHQLITDCQLIVNCQLVGQPPNMGREDGWLMGAADQFLDQGNGKI